MCQREGAGDTRVDANEFDGESQRSGEHKVSAEHIDIRQRVASPSNDRPRDHDQPRRLVQLSWMYRNIGRRQSSWEGDTPGKIGRASVIVAHEKTSDAADR